MNNQCYLNKREDTLPPRWDEKIVVPIVKEDVEKRKYDRKTAYPKRL